MRQWTSERASEVPRRSPPRASATASGAERARSARPGHFTGALGGQQPSASQHPIGARTRCSQLAHSLAVSPPPRLLHLRAARRDAPRPSFIHEHPASRRASTDMGETAPAAGASGGSLLTTAMSFPIAAAARRFGPMERWLGSVTGALGVAFGIFLFYQIGFVDGLFAADPSWSPRCKPTIAGAADADVGRSGRGAASGLPRFNAPSVANIVRSGSSRPSPRLSAQMSTMIDTARDRSAMTSSPSRRSTRYPARSSFRSRRSSARQRRP
jgi:hypothetical protein